jgi:hypothetical protein
VTLGGARAKSNFHLTPAPGHAPAPELVTESVRLRLCDHSQGRISNTCRASIPWTVLLRCASSPTIVVMNTTSSADHGIHNLLDMPPETVASLDPRRLVERYVAVWNTPDPERRRTLIHSLWAPTGEHVLDPPLAMRQAAQQIGFAAPLLEIRGYAALEARVARAHAEFVAPGEYVFRARDNAARVRNVVKFNWEMVSTATGAMAGVGLEVLVLDDAGRIVVDYQFVEP